MHIQSVKIENLRNISNAEISPIEGLNIIVGNNGAGKTTILESIYLLARAKSFRQKRSGRLIKEGTERLTLYAKLKTSDQRSHHIGLQKSTSQTEIRIDGQNLKKLSQLAHAIPLTIITPNLQRIIEEDPHHRRRLLNWGLFHVEHEYSELAYRYKKTLIQRNKSLKSSPEQLKVWDKQLITVGDQIYGYMSEYGRLWNETLSDLIDSSKLAKPIRLEVTPGWRKEEIFAEALERNLKIDRERGFTSCGPHRADIRLVQDGKHIKGLFSRGESKLTATLMVLSQMKILYQKSGESPVLLADDLRSELDMGRYKELIELIKEMNVQCFMTSLEFDKRDTLLPADAYRVFHVEHGEISVD